MSLWIESVAAPSATAHLAGQKCFLALVCVRERGTSTNTLIKNYTSKGDNNSPFFSGYVDMTPMRNPYLCCSVLGNFNTVTLNGNRNVVKKIPVTASPGDMIFDQTVTGMDYLDCSSQRCRGFLSNLQARSAT